MEAQVESAPQLWSLDVFFFARHTEPLSNEHDVAHRHTLAIWEGGA